MVRNAFDVLRGRGFVQQVTDADGVRELFDAGPVTVYVGYDPTADSLHVGHLFTIMLLKHLERLGNRPIAVLGGGTARVGDPSGKTELRQMLTGEQIEANAQRMRQQISTLLDVAAGKSLIVDNSEWLLDLRYVDFLRDIGRHFSVNRMLSAEAYKLRLERGLSFLEFNYQLLQAFDFLQLLRRHECRVQMGGDDQWGNIVAGTDLCRRVEQQVVFGVTTPLLLTATGQKMGKTADGAVWLDPHRLKPYDYYQYWVNTHDDDVARMLGYFTFLPMDEIEAVGKMSGSDLNAAKSVLAYEATRIVHGHEAATEAHAAAQGAFGGRSIPQTLVPSSATPRQLAADATAVPTTAVGSDELSDGGLHLVDLLVRTRLAGSKNEARRLIAQGCVRLNDAKPGDVHNTVTREQLTAGPVLLRVGKKKVHRLVLGR